ncbi:chorismate synthase [bacterium]|nr:chorismate synthase [bacterium]
MFRFLTAGESHGPCLTVIIEGLPAGLPLEVSRINYELARRQKGYGRGARMRIENDQIVISSGLRHGETLGSPLCLTISNRDWKNWQATMALEKLAAGIKIQRLQRPRPGHADLVGALKYDRQDLRDILERASARETAVRVAAGAVAKILLGIFDIQIGSWVEAIGGIQARFRLENPDRLTRQAEKSDVRCPDKVAAPAMRRVIDQAAKAGDTLGGIFALSAWGLPPGLGSHVQWDRRLDMRLAGAIMSIPAIKGVEFGLGFAGAGKPGSEVHDIITYSRNGKYGRRTNHAGGLEGGMSTGEPLLVRAAMKPIASLLHPLSSVDMQTKRVLKAGYERSDVCAVPAAAVVGEAVMAIELVKVWQEKFGGDSLAEMRNNWKNCLRRYSKR